MQFDHLSYELARWATFTSDNPAAIVIKREVENVFKRFRFSNDDTRVMLQIMSAVYQGGVDAGRASKAPEVFQAWEVWETTDEYGRHGSMIGLFTDETAANNFAHGKGWYGGAGSVTSVKAVNIDGTVYTIKATVKADDLNVDLPARVKQQRAAALAKLTPEERKLLGIQE